MHKQLRINTYKIWPNKVIVKHKRIKHFCASELPSPVSIQQPTASRCIKKEHIVASKYRH